MFLVLLFVVCERGISCRARELECLVRSLVFWEEKNGGENVYLLCTANSSQSALFVDAEAKKTSSRSRLWVFSVLHTSTHFWFSAVSLNSVSSVLPATNFTERRKSSVVLDMAFMAKHTLF